MDQNDLLLSIVVPMFNEEDGVDVFFETVEAVLSRMDVDYEIVCVNDGSRDGTLRCLLRHRERNPRIRVVDLSRNFGKDLALTAGLDRSLGDVVVPIDADLQDPPELIPAMLEKWREGYDVVYAVRRSREEDSRFKRFSAGGFYRLFNALSFWEIPFNTGDFRLMSRQVVDSLRQFPENNRFMKGLFSWVGFRQTGIEYVRVARAKGETKWNYWKLWNFALDGITAFSTIPLRLWSYVGALVSMLAFLYGTFLILLTLIFGRDVPGYTSIMVVILFLGGVQLLSIGVLGEYIGRIYIETKGRPIYIIRREYGLEDETGES